MNISFTYNFDYYPFGSAMPGRSYSPNDYRFGFNGHEKDGTDWTGSNGSHLDFGARIYDSRLGRFLSTDPWEKKYAWQTPYAYFSNSPISKIDWKGFGDPVEFESHKAVGGGDISIPSSSSIEYVKNDNEKTNTCTDQVQSFCFGSQTYTAKVEDNKFVGYFNEKGVEYNTPNIETNRVVLGDYMDVEIKVYNLNFETELQAIQIVKTSNNVPSATYEDGQGNVGFVDGGINSPAVGQFGAETNPGKPYYIGNLGNDPNQGSVGTITYRPAGSVRTGTLNIQDAPGAQNNFLSTVSFQTVIVAINFNNSGVNVVLGTFNWGFEYQYGQLSKTHEANKVKFDIFNNESINILINDYEDYSIQK